MTTDWTYLARQLGSLHEDGSESGGDNFAQKAFDEIFGDEWIESSVEHIISPKGGQELAMNCLRYIQSTKAANYAYQIYKTSGRERAERAVWLIKQIANPISIDWVEEFLNDENVIHWGIGVLDQLLWTEQIPYNDKAKYLLKLAEQNSNGHLKNHTDFIRKYMDERKNH